MEKEAVKNQLTTDEFAQAVGSKLFKPKEWLQWMSAAEVAACPELGLGRKQAYLARKWLVIRDAECIPIIEGRLLWLEGSERRGVDCGYIFYNCVLPGLVLRECRVEGCFFIGTRVSNVYVERGTHCGRLYFLAGSHVGGLGIHHDTNCEEIRCESGSVIGMMGMSEDGSCKSLTITESRLDMLTMFENGRIGLLRVDKGKCGYLRIEDGSECEEIWCEGGRIESVRISEAWCNELNVLRGGSIGWLSMRDNTCRQFRISDSEIGRAQLVRCRIATLNLGDKARGEFYLDNCEVAHFPLVKTVLPAETLISIVRSRFYVIQWQELTVLGRLFVRDCGALTSPVLLQEEDICPESPRPLLRIAESSMGKTEIMGCRLEEFTIECRNSNLSEAFITFG